MCVFVMSVDGSLIFNLYKKVAGWKLVLELGIEDCIEEERKGKEGVMK